MLLERGELRLALLLGLYQSRYLLGTLLLRFLEHRLSSVGLRLRLLSRLKLQFQRTSLLLKLLGKSLLHLQSLLLKLLGKILLHLQSLGIKLCAKERLLTGEFLLDERLQLLLQIRFRHGRLLVIGAGQAVPHGAVLQHVFLARLGGHGDDHERLVRAHGKGLALDGTNRKSGAVRLLDQRLLVHVVHLQEELVHGLVGFHAENAKGAVFYADDEVATAAVEKTTQGGQNLLKGARGHGCLELQVRALGQREDGAVGQRGEVHHGDKRSGKR